MKRTIRTLYSANDEYPVLLRGFRRPGGADHCQSTGSMHLVAALLPCVLFVLSGTVSAQRLTFDEAKARIPSLDLPSFSIGTIDGLTDRWERLQHGTATTIATWPVSKRQHPRVGPEIGWLGCYFNNDGIDPMQDEFFAPMGPEAPAILKVAMKEGLDVAVSLHSYSSAPTVLRPAYVPMEMQERVRSLAQQHNALLAERDLPHGAVFEAKPEGGEVPSPFNLTGALYHISGAMAFTHECPHGVVGEEMCDVTFDQILDIQLTLYEAIFRAALDGR